MSEQQAIMLWFSLFLFAFAVAGYVTWGLWFDNGEGD
jgi:hypothetical protein